MTGALATLQWLVTGGFVILGFLSVLDWRRHRGQRHAYLAAAIGLLAVVSISGRVNAATANRFAHLTTPVVVILFMASGYTLLLFRTTFVPLKPRTRALVGGLAAVSTVVFLVVAPPAGTVRMGATQSMALLVLILVWSGMVGEPVVRFWLAARSRPAVQRGRLRLLSAGYASIIFILVIAGAGGTRLNSSLLVQFGLQAFALLSIPLIYASFAPPRWLKRSWRESEESAFRRAVRELLLFSPDRTVLAERALDWGLRIIGADGGAILDGMDMLAIRGIRPELARQLAANAQVTAQTQIYPLDKASDDAVVVPLLLDKGRGAIVAVSNAFLPLFGSEEVLWLEEFGTSITAGLDRVRIVERMAQLEKTKSQFLNLASHEMRTPLSVIRGYISILETGSLGTLSAGVRNVLSILSAKALELNMLIEQMLEAARLEEGRLALKLESVDACDAADAALAVVRPLADDRHRLLLECESEQVRTRADRERLGTILVNLIDNAVKYSPAGGEVRCVVGAKDGSAVFAVQDQGIGIAAEHMPLLFTKFGRVADAGNEHIAGTGLGLYLCRELARQQGGEISVDSKPGSGSTFTLVLPLAEIEELPSTWRRTSKTVLQSTG